MSPLNERRLENFKKNRRGFWSLWIFLAIFGFTLFAEFIANDKPIAFTKNGELFLPVLFMYTEEELGGVLRTEADYRDEYVTNLFEPHGWSVWPPIRFSHDTIDWGLPISTMAPDARHVLGTEGWGSDIFARLIYGFRLSVFFGIGLTLISTAIGVLVGALQGYFGGYTDLIGQRIVEIWSGLPVLFILIILASMIEPNVFWLLGILSLFSWMFMVGLVRAEFLRARNFEFVRAARSLGVGNRTIMVRHLLPNAMVATLTYFPFLLNGSVTTLTALDFLGFGLPLDSPSLGRMLSSAKSNLQAPWIGISVFITLASMLTLLIFIGEAVRDALDPRKAIAAAD